jgi:hypothetical protein
MLALALIAWTGCGDDGGSAIDASPDAFETICGNPGDTGNELGIGRFCDRLADCTDATAPLCSKIGDPLAHFCTATCTPATEAEKCGTNATCTCNSGGQCGCTPNACLDG